ncbi:MAG: hypothetical protein M1834_008313 [Cirrosporium novae-zelandiae]|nr:MAG: hypothetical protein M1834_008313 [Cirrosporium novae-zelandiae]
MGNTELYIPTSPSTLSISNTPPSPITVKSIIRLQSSRPLSKLKKCTDSPNLTLPNIRPWLWTCHVCSRRYPVSVTRRCLNDGHQYCFGVTKHVRYGTLFHDRCITVFDYCGWQLWGNMKRAVSEFYIDEGQKHCWDNCDYPSECRRRVTWHCNPAGLDANMLEMGPLLRESEASKEEEIFPSDSEPETSDNEMQLDDDSDSGTGADIESDPKYPEMETESKMVYPVTTPNELATYETSSTSSTSPISYISPIGPGSSSSPTSLASDFSPTCPIDPTSLTTTMISTPPMCLREQILITSVAINTLDLSTPPLSPSPLTPHAITTPTTIDTPRLRRASSTGPNLFLEKITRAAERRSKSFKTLLSPVDEDSDAGRKLSLVAAKVDMAP